MNMLLDNLIIIEPAKITNIAAFVPARFASFRISSSIDFRTMQPGLIFASNTLLLLRCVRTAADARCDDNENSANVPDGVFGDFTPDRRERSGDIVLPLLGKALRASVPEMYGLWRFTKNT